MSDEPVTATRKTESTSSSSASTSNKTVLPQRHGSSAAANRASGSRDSGKPPQTADRSAAAHNEDDHGHGHDVGGLLGSLLGLGHSGGDDGGHHGKVAGEPGEAALPAAPAPSRVPHGKWGPPDPQRLKDAQRYVHDHAYIIQADGKHVPPSADEQLRLANTFARLPDTDINDLDKAGVNVAVVDPNHGPAGGYPGGGSQWPQANGGGAAGAYYTPDGKSIVLRQDYVADPNGQGNIDFTGLHEAGHAIDNIRQTDVLAKVFGGSGATYKSQTDPHAQQLYNDYKARTARNPNAVIDPEANNYAATSEQEFFAEGVREYTESPAERQRLQQRDPGLYQYVQNNLLHDAPPPPPPPSKPWWQKIFEPL